MVFNNTIRTSLNKLCCNNQLILTYNSFKIHMLFMLQMFKGLCKVKQIPQIQDNIGSVQISLGKKKELENHPKRVVTNYDFCVVSMTILGLQRHVWILVGGWIGRSASRFCL